MYQVALPEIHVEGLSKRFGRRRSSTVALADVSLSVSRGEVLALLGANGAGKSTAIKILATLLRPDAGHASIGGFDVVEEAPRVRELLGVVLQGVGVPPGGRVHQILTLHARLLGFDRVAAERRSEELLQATGLLQVADRRARSLSGGMRRRLDIALALIRRPPVLLLDEPSAGLDPPARHELWEELARLRDDGTCILLATQSIDEAERLSDRAAILVDGEALATDDSTDLLDRWLAGAHVGR